MAQTKAVINLKSLLDLTLHFFSHTPPATPEMSSNSAVDPPPLASSSIVLTEKQIPHFEKLCSNVLSAHGYIDGSVMGAGKTYVSCAIAQSYNLSLLVLCPVTVTSVWQNVAGSYGIPVVDIIGFEKLRSTKNHQLRHGLLTRFDAPPAPGGVKNKTSFSVTPYL